jgi:hypothetical protein
MCSRKFCWCHHYCEHHASARFVQTIDTFEDPFKGTMMNIAAQMTRQPISAIENAHLAISLGVSSPKISSDQIWAAGQ